MHCELQQIRNFIKGPLLKMHPSSRSLPENINIGALIQALDAVCRSPNGIPVLSDYASGPVF
jgi:hypothetical protein